MSERGRGGGTSVPDLPSLCRGCKTPGQRLQCSSEGFVFGDPFPEPASLSAHCDVPSARCPRRWGQGGLMPSLLQGNSLAAQQRAQLPAGWEPGPAVNKAGAESCAVPLLSHLLAAEQMDEQPCPQPPAPGILTLLKHSLRTPCPTRLLGRPQEQRPSCSSPHIHLLCLIHQHQVAFHASGKASSPPLPCRDGSKFRFAVSEMLFAGDNCALELLIQGLGAGRRVLEAGARQGAVGKLKLGQSGSATSTDFVLPLGASLLLTKQCFNSSPAQARLDLGKCQTLGLQLISAAQHRSGFAPCLVLPPAEGQ